MNARPNIFAWLSTVREEEQYYTNLVGGIRSGQIAFEVEEPPPLASLVRLNQIYISNMDDELKFETI